LTKIIVFGKKPLCKGIHNSPLGFGIWILLLPLPQNLITSGDFSLFTVNILAFYNRYFLNKKGDAK
jgi:hypothetical protein